MIAERDERGRARSYVKNHHPKNPRKGAEHYLWKGGISFDGRYYEVRSDNSRMRKYLHRIIMARHLGRELKRTEHVHHIDGNPRNNDITNLMLVSSSRHQNIHHIGSKRKRADLTG